ncbi:acetyl-CoA carboxylase biotin carboxyl carrier protein subunit [Micromonospora sp. NPDC049230]|uniref:acetyl-CoA carboxylase biotin carboxyl carrier protein n=1 Tax=Micromonospora sp. NPDC049230 TaxID=3155502 RepID=UPI0033C33E1A
MSQDTEDPTRMPAGENANVPESPAVSDIEASLELVRTNALQLLKGFSHAPSVLRIRAGGVTVEAEWPTGQPLPADPITLSTAPAPSVPTLDSPVVPAGVEVRAPAVGVLFHCPSPGAAPFVKVGDRVEAGQQIGIVEVMKLMIPVHSGCAGTVTAVLRGDGDAVEFDEPLFRIDPSGS